MEGKGNQTVVMMNREIRERERERERGLEIQQREFPNYEIGIWNRFWKQKFLSTSPLLKWNFEFPQDMFNDVVFF